MTRIALVRWRSETDADGLTSIVPDIDLDDYESWGAIDLRGSGKQYQSSADGVCLLVAPGREIAVAGALADLGDDPQTRLSAKVAAALSNRLGFNLIEATPGRIAAELLTLRASMVDPSRPNPLVGERRFPLSRTDLRRREVVRCGGVKMYDELGDLVDAEMTYYAETFPTVANPITAGAQDLPWDVASGNPALRIFSGSGYVGPICTTGGQYNANRMSSSVGDPDMFAEIVGGLVNFGTYYIGANVRMETAALTDSYGMRIYRGGWAHLLKWTGPQTSTTLSSNTSLSFTAFGPHTFYLEASGSSLSIDFDTTTVTSSTDTTYTTGTHAGIMVLGTIDANARIYDFATGQIGETAGGGGTTVTGTADATLGGLAATATGASWSTIAGQAAATLGALTATASGTPTTLGTAAATLGALTATATGKSTTFGTAVSTLGALAATAAGSSASVTSGTASAVLGALIVRSQLRDENGDIVVDENGDPIHVTGASGYIVVSTPDAGTASGVLGALSATAAGKRTAHGAGTATLGGLAATANGTGWATIVGQASGTLGGLTAAATGASKTFGVAAGTLGGLTATATGKRTVYGSAASTLGGLAGIASTMPRGEASATLGALTATAIGKSTTFGAAAAVFGGISGTVAGKRTAHGSSGSTLGALTATAAGKSTTFGTVGIVFGALSATALGKRTTHGTAVATLGGLTATATANVVAVTLHGLKVTGPVFAVTRTSTIHKVTRTSRIGV